VPNGVVWPTIGTAVWALRSSTSLEQALRRAVDVGGDTDTVACVTGQLAGAAYGVSAVPVRWASRVRGLVPGDPDPVARDGADLSALALRLAGVVPRPLAALAPRPLGPREVEPGLLVGDLLAASLVDDTTVVVSLCRTGDLVRVPDHLRVHLVDGAAPADNPRLSEVVDDVLDEVAAWRKPDAPCWCTAITAPPAPAFSCVRGCSANEGWATRRRSRRRVDAGSTPRPGTRGSSRSCGAAAAVVPPDGDGPSRTSAAGTSGPTFGR